MNIASLVVMGAALALFGLPPVRTQLTCGRCGWHPPAAKRSVKVSSTAELERAVGNARPGDQILLADGRYGLERTIEIPVANVTLRGESGDPARVVLHGRGMTNDPVGVAVGVGASGVTVADLTIQRVGFHAVQVRGENGASNFTLHNATLEDTGQQLLKGSIGDNGRFAADGLVACSKFSYTTAAPSDYTNGVDILGTRRWVIRDNRFSGIRGPLRVAGPSILAWQGAEDTLVERNLIVDSFRGIALGIRDRHGSLPYDHLRGIVRNNVVTNLNSWADEAIEANGAKDTRIHHNTVLVEGQPHWSISARFATASVEIRNNLTNKPVLARNGGVIVANDGNVSTATRSWFVDAPGFDFHISREGAGAVDAGGALPDVTEDFDRSPRFVGKSPDAGAFETGTRP